MRLQESERGACVCFSTSEPSCASHWVALAEAPCETKQISLKCVRKLPVVSLRLGLFLEESEIILRMMLCQTAFLTKSPLCKTKVQCRNCTKVLSTRAMNSLSIVVLQQHEAARGEGWSFQLLQQNKISPGMLLTGLPGYNREIPRCAYEQLMLKSLTL